MLLKSLCFTLAAAAIAATPTLAFATNYVVDGDFSSPYAGGGFTDYISGSSFGPWNVTGTGSGPYGGAGVDLIGGYWQAPNSVPGTGSVDLDGDAPGGISQTLSLTSGKSYTLSFYLSGNPDGYPTTKTVNVSVGNLNETFTYTLGASNSETNMNYVFEKVAFTASATNTLAFASQDNDGSPWGPVVGGVSVSSSVPEPSTWALMLAGFAGLGFAGYRRNRALNAA